MAQIIKHRRGSLSAVKDVTARVGELIVATGSISDLNGPMVFIGETEGVAGAYRPVSKIYQGTTVPTITVGSYGSTIDGTPFYASSNNTLYILNKDGNVAMNLVGNIQGNTISNLTITSLTGSDATFSSFVSASSLNVSGSTQVEQNLFVGGTTNLEGDLNITGNTVQTGSISLTGDVRVGGNIFIGDNPLDVIVFGGEVSSSIVPDVNNSFDLGSPTQAWGDLYISGTAYINNLILDTIQVDTISSSGDLNVSGSTTLYGSTLVDNLTDNRVVIVGTNGLLEDDANFTFDGTKLNVGEGDFEIDVANGNVRTSGSLTVVGTTELKNSVGINSSLSVTGSSQFKSTIDVDGQATLASANVQDLTNNRIVVVGTNGELEDDANFTFDGTKLNIGAGNFEVDVVDGDIRSSGSLTVDTLNVDNNLNVGGALSVTGSTSLLGDLYVSGNIQFLGSVTEVHISSSVVEIDDNIITLNAYSPFERYAGIEVIDSGSVGVSASLLWDSQNDYWMFVSSSGQTSRFVGTTTSTYGSETSLTLNRIPKATDGSTIGDSLLVDNSTVLSYNTNKFTVASTDGATLIAGNVTLSSSGGADAGSNTSAIVFRNASNVLGYVSVTETTDELDGILGYKTSNGALVFSTLIDGGTY